VSQLRRIIFNVSVALSLLLYMSAFTLKVASATKNLELLNQHWTTPCIDSFFTYRYRRMGADHGTFYFHDYYRSAIGAPSWHIELPLIVVVGAAAVLPIAWLYRRRSLNRFRPGCCAACNYDLRATPTRCPECGAVPKQIPLST
jgi:hypothetical protein